MKTLFNNTIATIKARFAAGFKTRSKRNAEMIEAMQLMYESRIDELECRIDELSDGFDQCVKEDSVEDMIDSSVDCHLASIEWSDVIEIDDLLHQADLNDYIDADGLCDQVMKNIARAIG